MPRRARARRRPRFCAAGCPSSTNASGSDVRMQKRRERQREAHLGRNLSKRRPQQYKGERRESPHGEAEGAPDVRVSQSSLFRYCYHPRSTNTVGVVHQVL
mgnify:CR=1 FL=1